jgi:hypothetical protein
MRGKSYIIAAAILAASAAGAVAREASTISKTEARSLPAPEVKRRVMNQLSEILTEERFNHRRPPVRLLDDMSFITRARATQVPNLCQIDRLEIIFEPQDTDGGNADTPVSAKGFSATRYFHFPRAPSAPYEASVDYDQAPNDAACREAKLWEDEFFTADDDRTATDGYLLAHRVIDAMIAGSPSFQLNCEKYPSETDRECADIARDIKTAQISSIDRCETDIPEFALASCYRAFVGDRSLRIIASPYAAGPNVPTPLTVLRVELDSLIIMAHERVD